MTAKNLRALTPLDEMIAVAQSALAVITAAPASRRPHPVADPPGSPLSAQDRSLAAALMRVNHVGEVCAQALYESQALFTRNPALRALFRAASAEESDHLAWTARRIGELGGRPSLLVPVWYGGAFAAGTLAAFAGDGLSLGFMAETERQVEAHLQGHLDRLPPEDRDSRAIVAQMKVDEAAHAASALDHGGVALPGAARLAMRLSARVMTTVAHYI